MIRTSAHVGQVYAAAICELATDADLIDVIGNDLLHLAEFATSQKEFVNFNISPYFPLEHKSQLLHKLFDGKVAALTMDFLEVVNKHNRMSCLPLIAQEYKKLRDLHFGCRLVKVTLSTAISEQEIKELTDRIAAALNGEVKLDIQIDPSIIGGIIVRHGDLIVDNSLRKGLRDAVMAIMSHRMRREKIHEV
jgi:F-type H+-transporting ATPase subunit delta